MKNILNSNFYAILHASGNMHKLFSLYCISQNEVQIGLVELLQEALTRKLDEFRSEKDINAINSLLLITLNCGLEKEVLLNNVKNEGNYNQIDNDEYSSDFELDSNNIDESEKGRRIQENSYNKKSASFCLINKLKKIDASYDTSFIGFLIGFKTQNRRITKRSVFLKLEYYLLKLYMRTLSSSALVTIFKHAINAPRIKRRILSDTELLYDTFDIVFMHDDIDSQKMASLMLNARLIDANNLYLVLEENYLHQAVQRELVEFFKELDSNLILANLKLTNKEGLDIFSLALENGCDEIATIIKQKVMQNEDAALYLKDKV